MKGRLYLALSLLLSLCWHAASAVPTLRVAYAGSMGVLMDGCAGPAFARSQHVHYQGIGQGSYALARLLGARQLRADVFIAITPGPMRMLRKAGLIGRARPVASTQMVIVYSPRSRFAADFKAAAAGHKPWYQVLMQPGLRFGRSDPLTDPQGRNMLFTLQLAERYYQQRGLRQRIAGTLRNPRQIFSETSLLSRLEAGQIDAAGGYLSAARSHRLPLIRLPEAINLSNPALVPHGYRLAAPSADGARPWRVQPLVFYAAVLKNAQQPALAQRFVDFLRSPQGQRLLRHNGYGAPKGAAL